MDRRAGADGGRTAAGSFTVEAALLMSMILLLFYFVIRLALSRQGLVEQEALRLLYLPDRYDSGLGPVDLIHIGEFIQEWIPPK